MAVLRGSRQGPHRPGARGGAGSRHAERGGARPARERPDDGRHPGQHGAGQQPDGQHGDETGGDRIRAGVFGRWAWRAGGQRAAVAGQASAALAEVEQPPPVPDPRTGAFFDLDNTLMQGASIYYFARGLAARKLFGPWDLVRMIWAQAYFRVVGSENSNHIDAARQAALAFVAGHDVADIVALCEEIYDETMADRIWEGTRELAQGHLQAGQRVWLVTATPAELAGIIARRLGFTGALGTVAESVDGVYTGRLVGGLLHGEAKAAAVAALAAREGLDLTRCAAYSDSTNDLPMLRLVGRPAAVNPDAALRATARAAGWPVHDFRSGRRATMAALPAAGAGAIAGGIAAGIALRRHHARG